MSYTMYKKGKLTARGMCSGVYVQGDMSGFRYSKHARGAFGR